MILSALSNQKRKIGPRNFVSEVSDHLGVTYHKMEGDFELTVDDEHVWFIDPLFLTPGMKGYDLNDYRAQEICNSTLEFLQNEESLGDVKFTTCVMPPQFGLKDEFAEIAGTFATSKFANSRFKFMRKYNGIIIVRNGRVIAVEKDYIPFRNNDFNIGVMLEFSGKADEYFGLTTLKNTLSIKEETKALFDKLGLVNEISNVRAERQKLFSEWRRPADIKVKDKGGNVVTAAELQQRSKERHQGTNQTLKHLKLLKRKAKIISKKLLKSWLRKRI